MTSLYVHTVCCKPRSPARKAGTTEIRDSMRLLSSAAMPRNPEIILICWAESPVSGNDGARISGNSDCYLINRDSQRPSRSFAFDSLSFEGQLYDTVASSVIHSRISRGLLRFGIVAFDGGRSAQTNGQPVAEAEPCGLLV